MLRRLCSGAGMGGWEAAWAACLTHEDCLPGLRHRLPQSLLVTLQGQGSLEIRESRYTTKQASSSSLYPGLQQGRGSSEAPCCLLRNDVDLCAGAANMGGQDAATGSMPWLWGLTCRGLSHPRAPKPGFPPWQRCPCGGIGRHTLPAWHDLQQLANLSGSLFPSLW